jgi:orotate phosphoribosyltransferase-like protein
MSMENFQYRYVEVAKRHGFNPVLLKEIVRLRNIGYNNTEIAQMLGISRNTVTKYLEKLKKTENKEVFELLVLIGVLVGGTYLITQLVKLLKKHQGGE